MVAAGTAGVTHLIARRFPWVCSLWLHLGLFALLASLAGRSIIQQPRVEPLSVDIVVERLLPAKLASPEDPTPSPTSAGDPDASAGQETTAPSPDAATDAAALSPEALPENAAPADDQPAAPEWITATRFHAAGVLSDHRSAQARQALATLAGADRKEQLCALEAMEQVRQLRPGFRPTRLAPHAMRNSFQKENRIIAPAAALRSNRIWYEIAYRCILDDGGTRITGFEFALGAPVDRALWDELGLAPVH